MTKSHPKKHHHRRTIKLPGSAKKASHRLRHQVDEAVRRVLDEYGEVIRKLGKE